MSEQQPKHIPFLNRENINTAQMTNLLNAFAITSGHLLHLGNIDEIHTVGGPLDGGTRAAVESTLINICNRIDSVLADDTRFNMKSQDALEAHLTECYAHNAGMLKAQAEAYNEITTPHHRYKPELVKLKEGSWLAYAGNPEDLDNALCGVGDCPAQAILAFDELFKGQVPEHLKTWLAARESAIAAGQPLPQNINQNEKTTLDTGRTDQTKRPAKKRGIRKPNRHSPGSHNSIGGT